MSDHPERSPALTGAVARSGSKTAKDSAKAAAEGPPVDVDALLQSVRARLDGSETAAASPSGEGLPAASGERAVAALPDEALARSFAVLSRIGAPDPHARIESHRAVVGPLVVLFKSALRRILAPAFSALFEQQAGFDRASLSYADEVYRRIVGMEADLRTRLERIEARQAMELETIERRLALLERGGGPGPGADGGGGRNG